MKRMKRLSFQWRITLLTAILIAGTCICSNLLLYRSGTVGIDSLNGFVMEYDPESSDVLKIEFDDQQMSAFLHQFSQEIYDVQNSEVNAGISQPQSHCLVQRSHIL